jgi:hypothetical protein
MVVEEESHRLVGGFITLQFVTEGEILVGLAFNDLDLFILILALLLVNCRGSNLGRLWCRGGSRRDGDRGNGLAGGRTGVDGHIRNGRGVQGGGDTENLVDVDVAALLCDLRVVLVEGVDVSSSLLPDGVASVAGNDNDGLLAVNLGGGKANLLTGNKVVAALVDDTGVESTELVGRDAVGSGNAVAVVARLDGVLASTLSSGSPVEEEGERGKSNGGFGEHGWNRRLGSGRLGKTTAKFNQRTEFVTL